MIPDPAHPDNSNVELLPKEFSWNTAPPVLPNEDGWYPVALPGKTVAV